MDFYRKCYLEQTYLNGVLMGKKQTINMEDLSLSPLIAGKYEGIYSVNELRDGNNFPIGCDLHKVNVQYQCELVVLQTPLSMDISTKNHS